MPQPPYPQPVGQQPVYPQPVMPYPQPPPGYPHTLPPGYNPYMMAPMYQGPPPGYNLGRAISPAEAGAKSRRIMSALFNVGKELKNVERSADYEQNGIIRNHMEKNRAYMNSTDDIESIAIRMDKVLRDENPEQYRPADLTALENEYVHSRPVPPVQTPQPAQTQPIQPIQPTPQYTIQTQPQTQIMPSVDINQYITPAAETPAPAPTFVQPAPQVVQPAVNLSTLENAFAELNQKIEAIAKMVGMLVQSQQTLVQTQQALIKNQTAAQQAMTVTLTDSIAKAVSSALNTFVEMQSGQEPELPDDVYDPSESEQG